MNHKYRKVGYDELEVRNKKTRVIMGYVHTRVPAAMGRSSVMRIQPLGSEELIGAFHTREEARKALEAWA